jgi:hypothetical protein
VLDVLDPVTEKLPATLTVWPDRPILIVVAFVAPIVKAPAADASIAAPQSSVDVEPTTGSVREADSRVKGDSFAMVSPEIVI